jgi:cytochrome c
MKIQPLLVFASTVALIACRDETAKWSRGLTGGDPTRGKIALNTYGCISCHSIPGVPGPNVLTAPPLIGISQRSYLAGMLQNTPENLERWIQHPRQVNPRTAMPEQGVTDQDARDIAAYLYTTR